MFASVTQTCVPVLLGGLVVCGLLSPSLLVDAKTAAPGASSEVACTGAAL